MEFQIAGWDEEQIWEKMSLVLNTWSSKCLWVLITWWAQLCLHCRVTSPEPAVHKDHPVPHGVKCKITFPLLCLIFRMYTFFYIHRVVQLLLPSNFRTFYHPKIETLSLLAVTLPSYPAPDNHYFLSVCVPFLDISYMWTHIGLAKKFIQIFL